MTLYMTSGGTVYKVRSPFAAVNDAGAGLLPDAFQLLPNYPNPFNATTTIRFLLPAADRVALRIYSALGQETARLLSEERAAGPHGVIWSALTLSSGIYYIVLESGICRIARSAVLVR